MLLQLCQGEIISAIKDLDHLIANSPKHLGKALVERGMCHHMLKNYTDAQKDYTGAIQRDEFNPEAYFQRLI